MLVLSNTAVATSQIVLYNHTNNRLIAGFSFCDANQINLRLFACAFPYLDRKKYPMVFKLGFHPSIILNIIIVCFYFLRDLRNIHSKQ